MGYHDSSLKKFIHSIKWLAPVFDILLFPFTFFAAIWFRLTRTWSIKRMPITRSLFLILGVYPLVDHYYDPLFDYRKSPHPNKIDASVPLHAEEQLAFFHDIFTPAGYPVNWLQEDFRLWNEQYLLEAFLVGNKDFRIICALNFLTNNHWTAIEHAFPVLGRATVKQPGSIWFRKIT